MINNYRLQNRHTSSHSCTFNFHPKLIWWYTVHWPRRLGGPSVSRKIRRLSPVQLRTRVRSCNRNYAALQLSLWFIPSKNRHSTLTPIRLCRERLGNRRLVSMHIGCLGVELCDITRDGSRQLATSERIMPLEIKISMTNVRHWRLNFVRTRNQRKQTELYGLD